ncbi:CHASE2 domain-containing protein [Luteimonas lutimaris]
MSQVIPHVGSRLAAWWARTRASSMRLGGRAPWFGKGFGLRRTLSVALALFLLVYPLKLLLDWIDPLSLPSASKLQSERLSSQLAAPFYGNKQPRAQDHIAVVLIDQKTLEARGIAWPPRYDYYEEVLRRIVRQGPRAVYVDLLVTRKREFDDSLGDARLALGEDLEAHPVPVYFGTDKPGRPSLFHDVEGVSELVTVWQGVDYPLAVSPAQQLGALEGASDRCDAGRENWSVAYGLYHDACPQAGMAGCREPAALMAPAQACREIAVQWGQRRPAGNARLDELDGQHCLAASDPGFSRGASAVRWLWSGLAGKLVPRAAADPRVPCPYTLTVHEEQLDDPDVAALLHDRVVLVGADLVGLNDLAANPVNGQIPGVYVHAMALDNLMTWGRAHLSPVRHAWLASLLLALFTSLLLAVVLRHAEHLGVGLAAAGLAIAFGPILVMHFWLRHPPVDWIGSLVVFAWVVFHARDAILMPGAPALATDDAAPASAAIPVPPATPAPPVQPVPSAPGDLP